MQGTAQRKPLTSRAGRLGKVNRRWIGPQGQYTPAASGGVTPA